MVRKTGILAGIIALILAFISKIPIYPPGNIELNFFIFVNENTEYFIWGYVSNGLSSFSPINSQFPENLAGIFFWCLTLFIGLSSISASGTKANFENSLTLYRINVLSCIFILIIYTIIILLITWANIINFFYTAGVGYYLLLVILSLNFIALHFLKKSNL